MATSEVPKHDFAPAWLKLPAQDNVKSAKHSNNFERASGSRHDWNYSRQFSAEASLDHLNSSHHQRTFEGYRGGSFNSDGYRHRSNSSLSFDSKYSHSNGRHYDGLNGRDVSNGVHQSSRAHVFNGPTVSPLRKNFHLDEKEAKLGGSEKGKIADLPRELEKKISLEPEEFPSLNGDFHAENRKQSGGVKVSSVWDSGSRESGNRTPGTGGDSVYKAFALKTGVIRKTIRGIDRSSTGRKASNSPSVQTKTPGSPVAVADVVLNTCLVTQPKNLGDKKSSFLKALRRENQDTASDLRDSSELSSPATLDGDEKKVFDEVFEENGVADKIPVATSPVSARPLRSTPTPIETVLLSSQEAEQKLLREMGWKEEEEDDGDYEITEAERLEFETLCKGFKGKQLKPMSTNGPRKDLFGGRQMSWTPPSQLTAFDDLNDTLSSTSDDSDLEVDQQVVVTSHNPTPNPDQPSSSPVF